MKFFKHFLFIYVLFALIFCMNISCFAEGTTYVWSNNSDKINTSNEKDIKETNAEISTEQKSNTTTEFTAETTTEQTTETTANISSTSNTVDLKLESPSAILIEQTTGQVLYEHNCHEKLRPASVTKIMSILLIMEQIDSRKA